MTPRWSEAKWEGQATTYGPLHVGTERLVGHTTESNAIPGFDGGKTEPHFVYDAANHAWTQQADIDQRVGTLISSKTTGVYANELSVQFEIVCYSDQALAFKRGGLWVGDFTDSHYADLAALVRWLRANTTMTLDRAYGPGKNFPSFRYGEYVSTRMLRSEWYDFVGGFTAHGAVSGQAHWDTGALNLHRIILLSGGTLTTTPKSEWNKLYNQQKDRKQYNSVVELVQRWLGSMDRYGKTHGLRTKATDAAVVKYKVEILGHTNAKPHIGSSLWAIIQADMFGGVATVPPQDCSSLEAALLVAQTKLLRANALIGQVHSDTAPQTNL